MTQKIQNLVHRISIVQYHFHIERSEVKVTRLYKPQVSHHVFKLGGSVAHVKYQAQAKLTKDCCAVPRPRYYFPTVPVLSPLLYFLVQQYHKYRGCSARYLSVVHTE